MGKVIFEDKWSKLTPEVLSIKCYYFPLGTSNDISVSSIKAVYFAEQGGSDQCFKVKGWGMSLSPCWWACDLRRNWHSSSGPTHFNVVIDCGESLYKGFTTINIEDLLSALKLVAQPETIYAHHFPF